MPPEFSKLADRSDPTVKKFVAARLTFLRRPAILLGVFVTYVIVAKLGLKLAVVHPSATVVWPPSGLALAVRAPIWILDLARYLCGCLCR